VADDYTIETAQLDAIHGHPEAMAMLHGIGRSGWQLVGSPTVYTDEDGKPAMCIVLRKDRPTGQGSQY